MNKILMLLIMTVILSSMAFANGEDCDFNIEARTSSQLFDKIPEIDKVLKKCPIELNGPAKTLLKNENILLKLDDKEAKFLFSGGKFTGITTSADGKSGFVVETKTCALDTLMKSDDKMGALSYYLSSKEVKISANGFKNKLKLLILKPFMKKALNNAKKPTEDLCV